MCDDKVSRRSEFLLEISSGFVRKCVSELEAEVVTLKAENRELKAKIAKLGVESEPVRVVSEPVRVVSEPVRVVSKDDRLDPLLKAVVEIFFESESK